MFDVWYYIDFTVSSLAISTETILHITHLNNKPMFYAIRL